MQCTQKVKASAWTRLASFLSGGNQKNNISGFLSNVKSYFSDKTATDWVFEFFFLYVELGAAAVLGVLVYAIAAMVGVGLFVSYGLTAVACALGLYWGRSMTQPMKEHRAGNKQKAKREIELEEQHNAVRMLDEYSRISEDLQTEMDVWMKDTSNLERRENVADAYKEVKALMQKQESAFSKLPVEDQKALKSKVSWFFEEQARHYTQSLIDLSESGFPVSSIIESLNERDMPQGWSRLNELFNVYEEEKKRRSQKTSQDAKEQSEESKKEVSSSTTKTTTGVESSELSYMPTTPTGVGNSNIADSKQENSTAQDGTSVLLHEGTESGPDEADQKDQGKDGSLSKVEKKRRSQKTSQDAKEPSRKSKNKVSSSTTKTTTGVESSELSDMLTTPTGVSDSHTADSEQETSTEQDGTSVLLHEDAENSLPNAKIDVKVEEESISPPRLGFFDLQNGTDSHDNEAELDADPSSAAGGLTNGDFQPTSP